MDTSLTDASARRVERKDREGDPVKRMTVAMASLCLGVLLAAGPAQGDEPADRAGNAKGGRIIVWVKNVLPGAPDKAMIKGLVSIDPESGEWQRIGDPDLVDGVVSPGGRYLAAGPSANSRDRVGLWVYDLFEKAPARRVFDRGCFSGCWADDGRHVIVGAPAGGRAFQTLRINADGTGQVTLPIPETQVVMDCTRDGTWLAAFDLPAQAGPVRRARINLVRSDGTESRVLLDEPGGASNWFRLSPDGQRLTYSLAMGERRQAKTTVWVVDADGRNRTKLPIEFEPGTLARPVWSPEGSRVAMGLTQTRAGLANTRVAVADIDGKNLRSFSMPPRDVILLDWK
jgi:hypothetical protein